MGRNTLRKTLEYSYGKFRTPVFCEAKSKLFYEIPFRTDEDIVNTMILSSPVASTSCVVMNADIKDYQNIFKLRINDSIYVVHGPTGLKYQIYYEGQAVDEDESDKIIA